MLLAVEPTLNYMTYRIGEPVVYLTNPYFVLQPVALVGAAYGARELRQRYHAVMQEMEIPERASEPEKLTDVVPTWLPWTFFLAGVVFNFSRVLARGGFDAIYRESGVPGLIAWGVVNPFIWAPIVAQFLAVYLSIEILAPRRLAASDVGIHFRDPEGLGGLRPIGELLKHAYYYLVAGLIAYALITYAPLVNPEDWTVTAVAHSVFTVAWIGTVLTVGIGVYVLHRFMHREKRRQLRRLERQANEYIDDPWDIANYSVPDDVQAEVDELLARMDRVSNTNGYPATFSIWSQLLVSIVLPKAIQLTLVAS
ncbi:MAG: hypothetical protein ABEJ90_03540 [Halobacterium sp.]